MKYLVVKHNTYYAISDESISIARKDGTVYMTINVTATNDAKKLDKHMRMLKFNVTFNCGTLALDMGPKQYKLENTGTIMVKSNDPNLKPKAITKSKVSFLEVDSNKITVKWSGILDLKACPSFDKNVEFDLAFTTYVKERTVA